ncbi:ATP-dependent Clp protease ATP-binding subunit [Natribacillus halophilus]|nr:ATP-dependent Clp protease ATP-binding subunit [Natribacillus halophilus]
MKCDHCQENDARIQMRINLNGNQRQLHLCESCYRDMRRHLRQPSGQSGNPQFDQMMNAMGGQQQDQGQSFANAQTQQGAGQGGGLLDELGKNLSHSANNGEIDPIIGRDQEVERVIETLNRRNKNNPVLIGEAGVGKTAIAEGLALRINQNQVPNKLRNKQIYLLDVSSLVANTGVRGQFEERMKQLISELQQRDDVIVFVDEVHQIVGAGSAEGSADAGNILKPALARGEVQLIGATTLAEYRKIEKDGALERRFQPVMVDEPSLEDAQKILEGLQPNYEQYHEVTYTPEAIAACVNLSDRYVQDRFLPDKAIDLMDEAGSKVNLLVSDLDDDEIYKRLEEIKIEKDDAANREDYETAAKLRTEELQLQEKQQQAKSENEHESVVDVTRIQSLVEAKTGIPVRRLQEDEQKKMRDLPERLNSQVIGQEKAVEKVSKSIRRNRAGLRRGTRPIGSFMFIGPTGVGKTELSKSLAEEMFGDRNAMIRLDMSEYMEKHSVSKLIGSPPGYVGHDEAGQLTERVRRKPYSIILLDEIEKAHPDVQHMFLQIMEDGHLTDSQGRKVSFKDTVLIMTSNAGSDMKKITVGFGADQEEENAMEGLTDYFKPEFLNRFDAIVRFNELSRDHLLTIVDLMLDDLKDSAEEQEVTIEVTKDAKQKMAELGYDPTFGARPLRRVIEEYVEDGIADEMLAHDEVKNVVVNIRDSQLNVAAK